MKDLQQLLVNLNINDDNIHKRLKFISLEKEQRDILIKLIPWAKKYSKEISKKFYDFQFAFKPTYELIESNANRKGITVSALREHLETALAQYYLGVFEGAQEDYGVNYFKKRMQVGIIHNNINLPLKWYLGSYDQFSRLSFEYIAKAKLDRKAESQALQAILSVFNLDMQIVSDAFLFSLLSSVGIEIDPNDISYGKDAFEEVGVIKNYSTALVEQASAIASGELEHNIFKNQINGGLGKSMFQIKDQLLSFVHTIEENNQALHEVTSNLQDASSIMKQNSDIAVEKSTNINSELSNQQEQMSSVSAAAEEMSSSVNEISSNVQKATVVAHDAVNKAENTHDLLENLNNSSKEIGKIVSVINNIAEQTNLLALNATIEAARAGEAGKGFAVVANEVKSLAKDTSSATFEISEKIETIQSSSNNVISAIGDIIGIIKVINESLVSIAAAMEQQTATISEIVINISKNTHAGENISVNMADVKESVDNTGQTIEQLSILSGSLVSMASQITETISFFKLGNDSE